MINREFNSPYQGYIAEQGKFDSIFEFSFSALLSTGACGTVGAEFIGADLPESVGWALSSLVTKNFYPAQKSYSAPLEKNNCSHHHYLIDGNGVRRAIDGLRIYYLQGGSAVGELYGPKKDQYHDSWELFL